MIFRLKVIVSRRFHLILLFSWGDKQIDANKENRTLQIMDNVMSADLRRQMKEVEEFENWI